jgi:uncharacterized protein (TIGR03067 family)
MRCLTALVAVLSLGSFALADERIKDPSKLEGTYKIVGGQTDGIPYTEEQMAGSVVTIKKNTMTFTDKDQKVFFSCTFTVDTTGTSDPQLVALTTVEPKKESSCRESSTGRLTQSGFAMRKRKKTRRPTSLPRRINTRSS